MASSNSNTTRKQHPEFVYGNPTMTLPKTRRKNHHQPPQAATTDYETDTAVFPDGFPPLRKRTNEELNLSVLRRYLPSVSTIVSIANYSVLYTFVASSQQWQKSEIEGTLFICALEPLASGAEEFSVVILNRRGLENFISKIKSPDHVEISDDFVYLKSEAHGEEQMYGLWIFSEPETSTVHAREINAHIIHECARRAEASRQVAAAEEEEVNNQRDADEDLAPEDDTEAESVPMGRQLSLRQLFGQQREHDSGWSVHVHQSPQEPPIQPVPTHQPSITSQAVPVAQFSRAAPATTTGSVPTQGRSKVSPTSQFQMHPDTAFFISGPSRTPSQHQWKAPQPRQLEQQQNGLKASPGNANGNALLDLLRGAKGS
jgi:hypothetical protein